MKREVFALALVVSFRKVVYGGRGRPHSEVECGYSTFDKDGKRLLQLDTYGSDAREIPGKTSQTLLLDRSGARELRNILEEAFPEL